jgi:hypothetical protein
MAPMEVMPAPPISEAKAEGSPIDPCQIPQETAKIPHAKQAIVNARQTDLVKIALSILFFSPESVNFHHEQYTYE